MCAQDVTVNRGEDVVFDTALQFVRGGFCNLTQSIDILELRKDGEEVHVVRCVNSQQLSCDADNNSFVYIKFGNTKKVNATDEDAGIYQLGVSVKDPNSPVLQKKFNVTIRGNYMDVW